MLACRAATAISPLWQTTCHILSVLADWRDLPGRPKDTLEPCLDAASLEIAQTNKKLAATESFLPQTHPTSPDAHLHAQPEIQNLFPEIMYIMKHHHLGCADWGDLPGHPEDLLESCLDAASSVPGCSGPSIRTCSRLAPELRRRQPAEGPGPARLCLHGPHVCC